MDFNLVDMWRDLNCNTKDFTWCKANISRRLDYLLCNQSCSHLFSNVNHLIVSCSDHKAIIAELNNLNFKRGPSQWQLNISLLNDTDYITFINNIIDNFLTFNTHTSYQRLWELLKAEIKSSSIQFCTEKNRLSKLKYNNRVKEINRISALLVMYPNCPTLNKQFSTL